MLHQMLLVDLLSNGKNVGGVVLAIDEITQHNSLELFFMYANEESNVYYVSQSMVYEFPKL